MGNDRTEAPPTPAQGGVAGGTYAPGDQSEAAQRSRFRQDQHSPEPGAPDPAPGDDRRDSPGEA